MPTGPSVVIELVRPEGHGALKQQIDQNAERLQALAKRGTASRNAGDLQSERREPTGLASLCFQRGARVARQFKEGRLC